MNWITEIIKAQGQRFKQKRKNIVYFFWTENKQCSYVLVKNIVYKNIVYKNIVYCSIVYQNLNKKDLM